MEELEFVQRKLLKVLIEETEKSVDQQDKSLINQLSKTIAENSMVLAEFGFAPPLLSRIKSLITIKYDSEKNNNDVDDKDLGRLKIQHQNTKSRFYLPLGNKDDNKFLESDDAPAVFQKICLCYF